MIRGTSYEQDGRFVNKDEQMLLKSIWPDHYSTKIDLSKVDMSVIRAWIDEGITRHLGHSDEICAGTAVCLLDQYLETGENPSAKKVHIALSGLLHAATLPFVSELWLLLDSAQQSAIGIPAILLEQRKLKEAEDRKKLDEIKRKNQAMNERKLKEGRKRSRSRRSRSKSRKRRKRSEEKKHKYRHRKRSHSKQKKRRRSSSSSSVLSESD